MTSILQNVTKDNVLLQLKRIAIGAALITPLVSIAYLIVYLINNDYLDGNTIYYVLQTLLVMFMMWSMGGAYESYKNMKRVEQEHKDNKTQRAFRKLGHGNT